jgi:hypothetical protein
MVFYGLGFPHTIGSFCYIVITCYSCLPTSCNITGRKELQLAIKTYLLAIVNQVHALLENQGYSSLPMPYLLFNALPLSSPMNNVHCTTPTHLPSVRPFLTTALLTLIESFI